MPALIPVTTPDVLTVPVAEDEDDQVPPVVASASFVVIALESVVFPEMLNGIAFTVTTGVLAILLVHPLPE